MDHAKIVTTKVIETYDEFATSLTKDKGDKAEHPCLNREAFGLFIESLKKDQIFKDGEISFNNWDIVKDNLVCLSEIFNQTNQGYYSVSAFY